MTNNHLLKIIQHLSDQLNRVEHTQTNIIKILEALVNQLEVK